MDQPRWVGLKGAEGSGKHDDASTEVSDTNEERSESRDPSPRGLSNR